MLRQTIAKLTAFVTTLSLALTFIAPSAAVAAPTPTFSHLHRVSHSASTNWSGYAAVSSLTQPQTGAVTDVKGTWVVPQVICTHDGYTSSWVGLDGYSDATVEQLGIESDCSGGRASYYAWYEMYPSASRAVTSRIHPGDVIKAEVKYSGGSRYRLSLTDTTSGAGFSTTQFSFRAQRQSAEWIVEAPSDFQGNTLPLAQFTTIPFSNGQATVNGHTAPVGHWANDPITLVNPTTFQPQAVPSALSPDGSAFSVTWQS